MQKLKDYEISVTTVTEERNIYAHARTVFESIFSSHAEKMEMLNCAVGPFSRLSRLV